MNTNLKDKIVVITGGAGFLGMTFSRAFLHAGAKVAIIDIAPDRELAKKKELLLPLAKHEPFLIHADITDEKSIKKAVSEIVRKYKQIDVLINNACLNPAPGTPGSKDEWSPYDTYPSALWRKELEVGLTGTFLMTKAVMANMKKNKTGSIINISSIYGLNGALPIFDKGLYKSIAYASMKGGIVNFTRAFAAYAGEFGVRVNTISLGGVFRSQPKTFVKKYEAHTMLRRMAKPEDVVGGALFLASDASSYMTGSNLVIDGGWSAW